jgi:hypothetical protein
MNALTMALTLLWLVLLARTETPQTDRPTNPQKLVPPSAYTKLPGTIRAKLQAHSCYLPETQSPEGGAEPINVVSGYFARENQLDWAAVCVIRDRPQIFVLWGRLPATCSSEIHSGWPLEENFSAELAGGIFLRKATPQRILNYRRAFPEGRKPPVTHDGLEVGNEQASLIFYCDSGRWLELRGND